MTFEQLLEQMNPAMYQSMKQAIELGKWPDGTRLDKTQKQLCMRALIVYENQNLPDHQRSGTLDANQECASKSASTSTSGSEDAEIIKWH